MLTRLLTLLLVVSFGFGLAEGRIHAVGKVTVDPNVGGTDVSMLTDAIDARLAQKVSYEARRKTVSAILADLTKATGVTLRAGYNSRDWQVRDRRMNIFAKDIPLATLLSSIARVMNFKWSISQEQPRTYRLYMDRRTLLDAEARSARRIQKNIEWQTKKRESWIEDIANVGKLSEQEIEKLRETNPYLYVYYKTGRADALNALFKASPDIAHALAMGEELRLNAASLPQDVQQAILQLRESSRLLRSTWTGNGRIPAYEEEPNLNTVDLIINEGVDRVARDGANSCHMGWITVRYGAQYSEQDLITPFPNPDFETTRLFGTEFVRSWETGQGADQVKFPKSTLDAAKVADHVKFGEDETPEGKPKEHPDDPALQKEVDCQPDDTRLDSVLAEVAKNCELSIISDSFGRPYNRLAIQGEMSIRELLDRIEAVHAEDWEKRGSLLELRKKDWFMERSAQLPEAWLEKWRQEAKNTGTLDLDTLWRINKLSYDQRRVNVYEDDVLGRMSLGADAGLMKIYDCLNASQRRTVTTSGTTSELNEAQMTALADLLKGVGSPVTRVTLTTSRKPLGKRLEYEVRLTGADGTQFGPWKLTTPECTEPEKDKPGQAPAKATPSH